MNTTTDLSVLNAAEARVLGCLIEKKDPTPDVYPLTLNGGAPAANQKTAREPVMALELGGGSPHAELTRTERGSCVKPSPRASSATSTSWRSVFSLTQPQIALARRC